MAGGLRGIFGYLFLVLMVRIAGRRPGKQMAPFEFVLIFFMGGLTLTPMVGDASFADERAGHDHGNSSNPLRNRSPKAGIAVVWAHS